MRICLVRSISWLSHGPGLTSVIGGRICLYGASPSAGFRWASTKKKKKRHDKNNKGKQEHQHVIPSTIPNSGRPVLPQPQRFEDHTAAAAAAAPEPSLSPEQAALVNLILAGHNVFYTGAAGTGKSLVLRAAVERLRKLGRRVVVVAPTGRAALAVNGITTWAYAGWAPSAHARPLSQLRKWSISKEKIVDRLAKTDVLVIDEISMVENHHLERLGEIMKEARSHAGRRVGWSNAHSIRQSAFGGCQIIATGDFFQLPPVRPFQYCIECGSQLLKERKQGKTTYRCPLGHGDWPDSSKWAFRSQVWDDADFVHVELKQIYRQAGDPIFIEILDRVRSGTLTYDDITVLTDPNREMKDLTNAVRLFPTRAEVARYNDDRLRELRTPPRDFVARDSFHWNEEAHSHLEARGERRADGTLATLKEHTYEPFLRLKVGMPVVLLSNINISEGLVNGSQGVVVGFDPVCNHNLNKSNRASADNDYINSIKSYEVFSYVTSPTHPVRAFPVVEFDNGIQRVIYPECSHYEVGNEVLPTMTDPDDEPPEPSAPSLLCRTQIPLIAGWAMSIHKAQGMTLGKVIVDLTRAFEEGQVYVALSRAKSLAGLKVQGDPRGLLVRQEGNPEVRDFYSENFKQ